MEARRRGRVQARYCNVRRPFSYGRGKRRMIVSRLCQIIPLTVSSAQAKGDDHQSVAATLIREEEKNKLSSTERAWIGGTM